MRWYWRALLRPQPAPEPGRPRSPFDAETIGPGDPAWGVWEAVRDTGRAVVGIYDTETGRVVAIRALGEGETP